MRVPRAAIVLERALRGRAHAFELALTPTSPVDDAPGTSRTEVVAVRLAERHRVERLSLQLLVVGGRIDLKFKPQLGEPRTYPRTLIPCPLRELDRFHEGTICLVESPSPEESLAEVSKNLCSVRGVYRHQC